MGTAKMDVVHLPPTATIQEVGAFLEEHGYVVITGLHSPFTMDRVKADIEPFARNTPICKEDFFGGGLRMFTGIIPKSPAYVALLDTPIVSQIARHVLGDDPLLNATAMYVLDKGGRGQTLHQDDETYRPAIVRAPGDPQVMINMMWAVVDFTKENGATRVIPGSHLWPAGRTPSPEDDVIQLEMPKGSLAVWLGSVFHGGGINHTNTQRIGAEMGFNLGWLRPYEAEHLVVPPALARDLPERVRALLGYRAYRGILGIIDRQNPDEALGWPTAGGGMKDEIRIGLGARELEQACRAHFGSLAAPPADDIQTSFDRLAKANAEWEAATTPARREVLQVTTNSRARELVASLQQSGMLDDVLMRGGEHRVVEKI